MMQKQNIKLGLGIAIAAMIGLGLGYLLFHSSDSAPVVTQSHEDHNHEDEIWTCSMHPQIRQDEAGDCPICGMDLIPIAASSSSDPLVLEMSPAAVKLAQIETSIIGQQTNADNSLSLSGKLQADERLAASQVAHIPGRIEKLYISFTGERIRKGQRIARIYSPDLIAAQQELLEAIKLKDSYPALLEAARQKLRFWKITEAQIQKIEAEGGIQQSFDLYADISGTVTARKVSVGDYLQKGSVLFEVQNFNRLWALFDVYEEDLNRIKLGDKISFQTTTIGAQSFETKISFIDPVINPQTRVASIRGEIANSKGVLKPEMFIRGKVNSQQSDPQLLVPKSAVLWTGKRSVVYLKVADRAVPSYRYQEVRLGERVGEHYIVESGVKSGDELVTQGSFAIDASAQLNNQASMMNQLVNVDDEKTAALADYKTEVSLVFKQQLALVVESYFALKDALVETDSIAANKGAKDFRTQLQEVEMHLLTAAAHDYWMQQSKALNSHADNLSSNHSIEAQRKQFGFLSSTLIETVKVLGSTNKELYVQHCPMAFDFEGADWLSQESQIRNPYYGDQMLTCGNVSLILSPTESNSTSTIHNH